MFLIFSLYSCLANGSPDEFQKGEHMVKSKAVKEVLQIGELLAVGKCLKGKLEYVGRISFKIFRRSLNVSHLSNQIWLFINSNPGARKAYLTRNRVSNNVVASRTFRCSRDDAIASDTFSQ